MSWLSFGKKISCQKTETYRGWEYRIEYEEEKIGLPLGDQDRIFKALSKSESVKIIYALSELMEYDILLEKGDNYFIPIEEYYSLPIDLIEILELPSKYTGNFKVTSSYNIGVEDFNVDIWIEDKNRFSKIYSQKDQLLRIGVKSYVLSSLQLQLFLAAKAIEDAKFGLEQFKALAKLKTIGKKLDVVFDDYIEAEDIAFADDIALDAELIKPEELQLKPLFNSLSEEQNDLINKANDIKTYYQGNGHGQIKSRIFIEPKLQPCVERIRQKRITGTDVPKFIKNPYPYIEDDLNVDLEVFSERVKGLKSIIYKAQPFIQVNEKEALNWFDFETGIRIDQQSEVGKEEMLSAEQFEKLLDEAKANEGYARFDDGWLEVDINSSEAYLESLKKYESIKENGDIPFNNMRQILDIFQNINDLEYNEGCIKVIKSIKAAGLDRFEHIEGLNANLYDYQKEGHQWLRSLDYLDLGGLLADDMGLGKTLQVISYFQRLKNKEFLKPSLVVVPSSLLDNWQSEIVKFSDNIQSCIYHKSKGVLTDYFDLCDVYITTYQTLVNQQLDLGKVDWRVLVCDEAQKIKNASTYASNAVKAMKANRKLALTGTPVENGLSELWSIVDYVQPGLLFSYKQFKEEFESPIQKVATEESEYKVDQLIEKLKPIYMRRTKEEKLEGMPSFEEITLFAALSKEQLKLYLEQIIIAKNDKSRILASLNNMLTICSHPRAYTGELNATTKQLLKEAPKLEESIELLNEIKSKSEKVIIFTKYRNMQMILKQVISDIFGIYPHIINGDMKGNRLLAIEDFSDKKGFNVMILSPRAAGMGLNITSANHVIHYTRDWNPAVEKQSTDRVYRMGQKKDVQVYYPITTYTQNETVEEKLNYLLLQKKKLIEKVVVPREQYQVKANDLMDVFETN